MMMAGEALAAAGIRKKKNNNNGALGWDRLAPQPTTGTWTLPPIRIDFAVINPDVFNNRKGKISLTSQTTSFLFRNSNTFFSRTSQEIRIQVPTEMTKTYLAEPSAWLINLSQCCVFAKKVRQNYRSGSDNRLQK